MKLRGRHWKLGVAITMTAMIGLSGCSGKDSAEAPVMFRGDAAHTGVFQKDSESQKPKGILKWQTKVEGAVYSSPVVYQGRIYLGTDDKKLYALQAKDGSVDWTFLADGAVRSTPLVTDDLVYFNTDGGTVYALNRADGSVEWTYDMAYQDANLDEWDYFRASPVLSGELLYVGSGNGKLYALEADSGELAWTADTRNEHTPIRSTPAVTEGTLFFADWKGIVYALDAKTGNEKWNKSVGASVQSAIAVMDGLVYGGGRSSDFFALDAATGDKKWDFFEPHGSWMPSSPAVHHESSTLYVGSSDALEVFAFNAATGEQKWSYKHGTHLFSSPAYADGVVYIASGYVYDEDHDEYLLAFDAETGSKLWELPITRSHSSPFLDKGVLYIASVDGQVYAVE